MDIEKKVSSMRYSDDNKDIRTFEFVAKLFNTTLDNVAKWFILLLIVVFDPFAIALILAYNVVIYKNPVVNPTIVEPTAVLEPSDSDETDKKKVVQNHLTQFPFQKIPKAFPKANSEPLTEIPAPAKDGVSADVSEFMKGYFKT